MACEKSRYSPIWEELKKNGTVTIVASPALHKRIVKAVLKRKNLDVGYKFQQSELGYDCFVSHKKIGTQVIFMLRKRIRFSHL